MIVLVRDLCVTYEAAVPVHAVRNVSFDVDGGEFVSIVGPSGSGKTSILYVLGAIRPPTSGQVTIDGVELASASEVTRNRLRSDAIGFVFQDFHLLQRSSVLENVALGSLYAGERRSRRLDEAKGLLAAVGLDHLAGATPRNLSGGERQRTAIARALMGTPSLLLCDEPTGNLDTQSTEAVVRLLDRLRSNGGPAVVVVTHDPQVQAASDRALTLRDGILDPDGVEDSDA